MPYVAYGYPATLRCLPEAQAQRQSVAAVLFSADAQLLAVVTSAAVQFWSAGQACAAACARARVGARQSASSSSSASRRVASRRVVSRR